MNVRYGQPSAPAPLCVICSCSSFQQRVFPCGCVYPIHDPCIPYFRRQGGVCPTCHQVWIPIDADGQTEVTNALTTQSQREWLLSQHPHSRTRTGCGSCRSTFYYSLCCVLLLVAIGFCSYLLIRVYG